MPTGFVNYEGLCNISTLALRNRSENMADIASFRIFTVAFLVKYRITICSVEIFDFIIFSSVQDKNTFFETYRNVHISSDLFIFTEIA